MNTLFRESWQMVDETYPMNDAGEGSHILLRARHFRGSRVFCLALGHDSKAFSHPCFRKLLGRGIPSALLSYLHRPA
ncbi:MAG TPA: hypothetical protein ENI27_05475 [bacterium]|nr:hypothetical protein [bacterium]